MKAESKVFELQTKKIYEFTDFTDEIISFIEEIKIKNGLVNIQSLHTTAAIIVNENEPLLLEDIRSHLKNFIQKDISYKHDDFSIRTVNMCDDECKNGHSHCTAIHLPTSATLNVLEGKIQLGQWQRIFFVELDRSRPRKFQALVMGE